MTQQVTVGHNFETGHRLPNLPGKCVSLHGHSWWVDITVTAETGDADIVVEFGAFKRVLRDWIDEHLDHGVMLGPDDPLIAPLRDADCKVYVTPGWPTVEAVAAHLAAVAGILLDKVDHADGAHVSAVDVQETRVNGAAWVAP